MSVGLVNFIDIGWTTKEDEVFDACKTALSRQVTLAPSDESKRLDVYTDASDFFWSEIVTQVLLDDLNLPRQDKRQESLAFLSGRFTKQQIRWATLKKEAYAVRATLNRMHWLLATTSGFDLFTDHKNLIFLFDPTSVTADLSLKTL